MVNAVGAVGILASFTDGPSMLYIYPSAGTIPMHRSQQLHPSRRAGGRSRAALTVGKSSWSISIGPYKKRTTKT
jgi:hypothetical protein